MNIFLAILSILYNAPPIFGPFLLWWAWSIGRRLERRAFNRRNVAGLETFSDFGTMKKTRFLEGCMGLAQALIFILGLVLTVRLGINVWLHGAGADSVFGRN
jgi:hypothetical protein